MNSARRALVAAMTALRVHLLTDVTGVEQHSRVLEPGRIAHRARELHRAFRRGHTHAMHAGIDFDQHAHARARSAQRLERGQRIERDGHAFAFRQRDQALQLGRAHRRIRDQDIVGDAGHGLRLMQRRDRDTARTAAQLLARQLGRLVRFGVRPEGQTMTAGIGSHGIKIGGHRGDIHNGRRGYQLVQRARVAHLPSGSTL